MTQQIERFGDNAILKLDIDGFADLSLNQKHLVFHLSNAGLYGRDLYLQQTYKHNLLIRNTLETIYTSFTKEAIADSAMLQNFEMYLKEFWVHCGIYNSFSNKRLEVPFSESAFNDIVDSTNIEFPVSDLSLVRKVLFDPVFTKEYMNIQTEGVDVVAESGGNFYENMTQAEVEAIREAKPDYLPDTTGFNVRMSKDENDEVKYEHIYAHGLYGDQVKNIVKHLAAAMDYAENVQQLQSIYTLMEFYNTGTAEDFDNHCVEWTKDKDSNIYFINGLIESYDDPLGVGCTFESLVAFKNPTETEKVERIITNIQWLEDNMPFNSKYKKTEAGGLSASSITVASMAGATSPKLPLGICLPNADWIREKIGSKSVNLANVHNARSESADDIRKEFFLEQYYDLLEEHNRTSSSLHTDLHEVAGHGSGRLLKGVAPDSLGIYSAVIEEARADLVGLYYVADAAMQEFGIIDADVNINDFALTQYVSYLTGGSILQLRRIELGADLAQPHMRDRQLISNWVLEHAKESLAAFMVYTDGKHYIEVTDIAACRVLFGELLTIIQDIKSTGNIDAARNLVEQYGTKVEYDLHKEVLDRVAAINPASFHGFTTPIYTPVYDNGEITDYTATQKDTFAEDQLHLSTTYKS